MAWITTLYMNHSLNLSRITLRHFCAVVYTEELAVFLPWKKWSVVKLARRHNWELQTEPSNNNSLCNLYRSVFENKCNLCVGPPATHGDEPSLAAARLHLGVHAHGTCLKCVRGLCFSRLIKGWLNTKVWREEEKRRESSYAPLVEEG